MDVMIAPFVTAQTLFGIIADLPRDGLPRGLVWLPARSRVILRDSRERHVSQHPATSSDGHPLMGFNAGRIGTVEVAYPGLILVCRQIFPADWIVRLELIGRAPTGEMYQRLMAQIFATTYGVAVTPAMVAEEKAPM